MAAMVTAAFEELGIKPEREGNLLVPQLKVEKTSKVDGVKGYVTEAHETLQVCAVLDTTNDNVIEVPPRWETFSGCEATLVGLVILADDDNPESRYARLEPFSLSRSGRPLRDSGPHKWSGNYASSDDPRFTSVVEKYLGEPAERFRVYDGIPVAGSADPQE
ncbi:hypothetical protein [Nocardia brasiliensis]|uniref:hypothetical protein n=1 Tax=Nocardia brasiliensis TaxID=37326 RepID=UPI002454F6B7|nr:hypothetical protein [Nocardia brasiliensis]